jgi:hypothetical protein
MSLKDLFSNLNSSIVSSGSIEKMASEVESADYIQSYSKQRDKLRAHNDFTKPESFAKFGSAEKYYTDSIERIYKTYPYDGSLKEKVDWELSSSGIDLHLFDNEYPRTNGFVNFSPSGWGSSLASEAGYSEPEDKEYIFVKGGPNTSTRGKGQDIDDASGNYYSGYANTYDLSLDRDSNLRIDGKAGNTIEFWMKKKDFLVGPNTREVIYDSYTTEFSAGNANYGRLSLALTGTLYSNGPFLITYMSGNAGASLFALGDGLALADIADDEWHHYAVTLKNDGSNLESKLFVDGVHNQTRLVTALDITNTGPPAVNYVSGNMNATIGSLATIPSGSTSPTLGWGKLSGSLDEFRLWKVSRDAQQIGRQYIEPVGAGSNSDEANTDLGVYYKFNEGITLLDAVDDNILDYSGRISNGAFVGYNSNTRETGSAIVLSKKADSEFKDPILYDFHPDVKTLIDKKKKIGQEHDYANPNSIYNSIPDWITESDSKKNSPPLKNLTQIISSYFDTLANQIEDLAKLKDITYASGTLGNNEKPYFFNDRILQGSGFPYIPELFSDASFFEFFRNRSDTQLFEEKLYDVKNTIYRNIYNNLAYINKTKGTEKSFRNLLRCFGVDDEIYKIRHYATDAVFEFRDNYKSIVENKNYVNFALTASAEATVYQYQTDSNTTSYITASAETTGLEGSGFGFSVETQAIFPFVGSEAEYNTLIKSKDRSKTYYVQDFVTDLEASVFGIRSVDKAAAENDLTVPSNDRTGFVVKVVRDNSFDKRAYFKVEPTDATSYFPTITSSYFEEVFDDSKWNFAVTVKPSNYGQFNFVSGSTDDIDYEVVFHGVESALDEVRNSFAVSSSISKAFGQTILTTPKRVFVGAYREDFSGSLLTRSNAYITDCRFWLAPLSFNDVKRHNFDFENFGIENPYQSAYLFQSTGSAPRVPNIETLALHWDFTSLTSSNNSGQFDVTDLSSGSASDNRYGDLSNILSRQHPARGNFFLSGSTKTFQKKDIYNARTQLPEFINSSDMVFIRDQDDVTFTRSTRPTNYLMTIEKSMYQTVSEEMLKVFSTVVDFGSMVGDPVNNYRAEYKNLSKLRQLFFENVSNTPKIEKYVDYYRWLDSGLNSMLANLIPASAVTFDDDNLIRPIIEEYIFNRNKYDHKFPTMEFKQSDPIGHILGIREGLYNYRYGSAVQPNLGQIQEEHCFWWKNRAKRSLSGSGNTSIDSNRQTMLDSKNNLNNAVAPNLSSSFGGGYEGSTYAVRNFARPYKYKVDLTPTIKGGTNFDHNRKVNYWSSGFRTDFLAATSASIHSFIATGSCDDEFVPNKKVFRHFSFDNDGIPSNITAPFNVVSASFTTAGTFGRESKKQIVDIHYDAYGSDSETSIQGPFTNEHVGGYQHRHVSLNTGADSIDDRPERFRVTASVDSIHIYNSDQNLDGTLNTLLPRADYYRGEMIKRPVNIRNIQSTTGSSVLGNYYQDYEIVSTAGRTENNRLFVKAEGDLLTASSEVYNFSGALDYAIPNRSATGSNKFIFVNRFSAPGDPSTMGEGFLDWPAGEYSVYNSLPWRNLDVRLLLQELLTDHSKKGGYFSDWARVRDWQEAGSGSSYPGESSSINSLDYSGSGSFQKNHRNTRKQPKYSTNKTGPAGIVNITASYDNFYVRHQIPQTDMQYAWISSSVVQDYSGSILYGFEKPDFSNAAFASSDIIFQSCSIEPISQEIPIDFAYLRTIVTDGVHISQNLLSGTDYFASEITSSTKLMTSSFSTNAILLNRNGPYGGANWKLYRKEDHPITRKLRRDNRVSFLTSSVIVDSEGLQKTIQGLHQIIEPPLNSKHKPVTFDLDIKTAPFTGGETRVTFEQSYLNNFVRFSDKINDSLDLNMIGAFEEVKGYPTQKLAYNALAFLITDTSVSEKTNPINKVHSISTNETIYPREKFTYLEETRKRTNFVNLVWRDDRTTRSEEGSTLFSVGTPFGSTPPQMGTSFAASIWPLDARGGPTGGATAQAGSYESNNFPGTPSTTTKGALQSGILQNDCAQFAAGIVTAGIPYGNCYPVFNRRVVEYAKGAYYKTGDTKWEAGEQAGVNPFYDTYDDYVDELMRMGKNYGILPEFRISEHMDYYVNQNGGNFLAENTEILSLTGAAIQNTPGTDFIVNYSHSDFLKAFAIVNQDFKKQIPATRLEFECDGILKFLPYTDFFPAQRTVTLGEMFLDDYSDVIFDARRNHIGAGTAASANGRVVVARPIFQSLYSPGIMYNSIKSGLAVDYPFSVSAPGFTGSIEQTKAEAGDFFMRNIPRISSSFDFRVPFEAIIKPGSYLMDRAIFDQEPHPSAHLNLTASLLGPGRHTYSLAANNFFAATIDFFRPHGQMATLASLPDDHGNFGLFKKGSKYIMDITLSNATVNSYQEIANLFVQSAGGTPTNYTSASYILNPPTCVMYQRTASVNVFGSSFGPPVNNTGSVLSSCSFDGRFITGPEKLHSSASYEAFTPPYYNGYSRIRLEYNPKSTRRYTVEEIVPELTESFTRFCLDHRTRNDTDSQMELSASLNYKQISRQYGVKYDPVGNPIEIDTSQQSNQLVIQPKWETPFLDFKDARPAKPIRGSGSIAQGIWHQYGLIPSASSQGLFMQIQDSADDSDLSLADAMGFKKSPVRVGEIAQQKEIFEAIVAIPHVYHTLGKESDEKARFLIPRETIDIAERILKEGGISEKTENYIQSVGPENRPTKDIVNMVKKMKKYILPPALDFITNKTVSPFAMLIFEFSAVLTQTDLSKIWQNLPPDIGVSAQKSKASLPIDIFKSDESKGKAMLDSIPNNLQWSVFKIKQRGAFNYFSKVADSKADSRFKFNFEVGSAGAEKESVPDYSYNWPYDFFSLVELAKIDCKVEFGKPYRVESFPKVVPDPATPSVDKVQNKQNQNSFTQLLEPSAAEQAAGGAAIRATKTAATTGKAELVATLTKEVSKALAKTKTPKLSGPKFGGTGSKSVVPKD